MRQAEQVTMGILKERLSEVLYALVQGTHVTRTRGEAVARPQLERRESYA